MKWSSSKITSSLRSKNRSEGVNTRPAPGRPTEAVVPEPQEYTDSSSRTIWHRELKKCVEALSFLETGNPPCESVDLDKLLQPTTDYIRRDQKINPRSSSNFDLVLNRLIDHYALGDQIYRPLAVLACLRAFSEAEAPRYLLSLEDHVPAPKYLRCVALGGRIRSSMLLKKDLRLARFLLMISDDDRHAGHGFQDLINELNVNTSHVVVSIGIINRSLYSSQGWVRIRKGLELDLESRRYLNAYISSSWLQTLPENLNNTTVTILNEHLPSWAWLRTWRPNVERIKLWQDGKFSEAQREKLLHVFDLDGPDPFTRKKALILADPHCYEHIDIAPQSNEMLREFLGLLCRAHAVGPSALDLFVHFCIDSQANANSMSTVNDALLKNNDAYSKSILMILAPGESQLSLVRQMTSLTNALPALNRNVHLASTVLAGQLKTVIEAAQPKFLSLLTKGPGEVMGMYIFDLGKAIVEASNTHTNLPPELLQRLKQLPSREAILSMFRQIGDSKCSETIDKRFRSYLAFALGGFCDPGGQPVTLAAIQEEVKFWESHPGSMRSDFAKTLEKIQSFHYPQYTECLLIMLKEHDLYIEEMKSMIILDSEGSCINFANYLARRRKLNQLQDNCWLLLLSALMDDQGPQYLSKMSDQLPLEHWQKFVTDISQLIAPALSALPATGTGLTQQRIAWWKTIAGNADAVQYMYKKQGSRGNLTWLYFPVRQGYAEQIISIINNRQTLNPDHQVILSCLKPGGKNIGSICKCLTALANTSDNGRAVCARLIHRISNPGGSKWDERKDHGIGVALEIWRRSGQLNQQDKTAIDLIRRVLRLSTSVQDYLWLGTESLLSTLQSDYSQLIIDAKNMEGIRMRLQRQSPTQLATLLGELDISNTTTGRVIDFEIPESLAHAIETMGHKQYEFSFALTGLSDLQRKARGIPQEARLLVIRLCLRGSASTFCSHLSPNGEDGEQDYHLDWKPAVDGEPDGQVCTTKPSLFTYYLNRKIQAMLRSGTSSIQTMYDGIHKFMTGSPALCHVCLGSLNIKLWKPATCTKACSIKLRRAPLEVRLHNLLVDPLAIDLLLTAVYAAARDQSGLKLLPGCPIDKARLHAVIDSLPPLTTYQKTFNLKQALAAPDGMAADREKLLSWLCLKFRGFMLSAPAGFRVPSMPNTQQFLMMNAPPEQEMQFNNHFIAGNTGPVFHGTQASRLFLILTEGLRTKSHSPFQVHGAAGGTGIYCADNQATSQPYAGSTGQSWRHSALSNMKVMLGCELAKHTAQNVHVIPNHDRLLVRYVFLLPLTYQPPPRHHVEPAMSTAFASLRSGVLT